MENSLIDFVQGDVVVQGRQTRLVMVKNKAELSKLVPYGYNPGTLAFTSGMKNIWQLDADGAWQPVIEEEE